jgi:hypothetical protein
MYLQAIPSICILEIPFMWLSKVAIKLAAQVIQELIRIMSGMELFPPEGHIIWQ